MRLPVCKGRKPEHRVKDCTSVISAAKVLASHLQLHGGVSIPITKKKCKLPRAKLPKGPYNVTNRMRADSIHICTRLQQKFNRLRMTCKKASCKTVRPALFRALGFAPYCNRSFAVWMCLLAIAQCRGVRPLSTIASC